MPNIANEDLRLWNIPSTQTKEIWHEWRDFALTFDGYDYCKEVSKDLFKFQESIGTFFVRNKNLPTDLKLSELRACLFAVQRIWRNSGEWELGSQHKAYIKKLINAIRDMVKQNRGPSGSLIDQALEFAAYAHRNQKRKGTEIPYISHPFAVGMILQQAGCSEEVIAGGILHDTLEDTDTTERQLLSMFGPVVLEIVNGCSEPDKDASWEERKQHTLEELKHANLLIRQTACADKIHNIRSIKRDLKTYGEDAWTRFKRGRESQQWYYKGLVESLGYASRFPLLDELQDEVEEVFGSPLVNSEWKKLRRNRKFIDLAFETAYCDPIPFQEREPQFKQFGASELMAQVHQRAYPIHPEYEQDFNGLAEYLLNRGIEFQSNSDGPIIQIGFSTALMRLLNLYPHEVFHHFKRNLKRGIL